MVTLQNTFLREINNHRMKTDILCQEKFGKWCTLDPSEVYNILVPSAGMELVYVLMPAFPNIL